MTDQANFDVTEINGVTVVTFGSECDNLFEGMLAPIQDRLLELGKTVDPPLVVIDLQNIKFMGSAFLALLVRVSNSLKARDGGHFAICGMTPFCAAIFQKSQLDQIWDIFDSVDEGVKQMTSSTEPGS
jgi:anti-anti-sigma factor